MGGHSFPKSERLLKRADFLKLSRFGKKIQTRFFIAAVMESQTATNRLGITVSKKVGKAAERNRIKRIIREYYRQRTTLRGGNRDINIIARKTASDLQNPQVFEEIQRLFRKIEARS